MSSTDPLREMPNAGKSITKLLCLETAAIVVGSSFQFGYNTGVINAPQAYIKEFLNETYYQRYQTQITSSTLTLLWSFAVAIIAIGGMLGSLIAAPMSQKFGRKKSLLLNNILAFIGAGLMGFSKLASSYGMLIAGRFVIGLNNGINMGIAPMYLTEISPVKYRGILGTLNQLGVVSAILLSQVLGLNWVLGTDELWPLLLGLTAVFAVFQTCTLPFCPESPRYLLVYKDDEEESRKALVKLRGKDYDITEEIDSMKEEYEEEQKERSVGIIEIFTTSYLRKPMIIAIVMQLSQQLSGINAVFYYSTPLFIAAGIPEEYSALPTVGVGVVNVVMTLVSLSLIERAGRRLLHLTGLAGMFVCAVVLTITLTLQVDADWLSWFSLVPVLLFVASFQIGPGSIPWFITAELFTQGPRPTAISIAGLVNWLGNFTIALAYPPLNELIGGFTFAIFAGLLALFWIFTYLRVPETKGRTINEITAQFRSAVDEYDDNKKFYNSSTKL
ncbi:solute carrier family 2, facilitated glucose transporter member 1-like [Styela clava]|uniref:solute carrier family 2, facilitated glucose transporter member 1-like n=1 Tax=Styela clava TaxID=7725 RepID=UPI001939F0BB|nr:solute carrier family 2, facilitated glucose transporter member 1-like [Styela clava]